MCVFSFLPAVGGCKQAVTQTDRVRQGGKVKMERSLAPDQDRRHNVPSSSQPPNKAVPHRAPWHRRTKELRLRAKLTRYKEGPKLRGESGYKKHKAPEPVADNAGLRRSAAGWRPESRQARRRQRTTVGVAAFKQQRLCLQLHRSQQLQNLLSTDY